MTRPFLFADCRSLLCALDGLWTANRQCDTRVQGAASKFTVCSTASASVSPSIALDGARKNKKITNARCEGILSSEFKHGPLSAVRDGYPVLFITVPGDEAMMINHINEVTTRSGRSIAVAAEHPALRANGHDYLVGLDAERFLSPIPATIPAQPVTNYLSGKGHRP